MLWVLILLAAFFTLVSVSRLRLAVSFQDTFQFEVRFWFWRIRLPAQKKAKPKKAKAVKAEKPQKQKAKPDLSFFLSHFSELFDLFKKLIAATGRRLTVDRLYIDLHIHESDAATTAIRYGQACTLIYTASAFVESALRVRAHDIRVTPLFQEGETAVIFSVELSIRVFSIITLAATQGVAVVKMIFSFMRSSKDATIQKDGAVL